MAKANRVHSTPRRTASKIQPRKVIKKDLTGPDSFPDIYSMKVAGYCLEPSIPDGAVIVFKKSEKVAAGDFIAVWFRETDGADHAWIKRLTMNIPPWVKFPYKDHPRSNVKALARFEQLNPHQTYTVPCDRICALHKAMGFIPGGAVVGGNVNTADMQPMPTGEG